LQRVSCRLDLPTVKAGKLTAREIYMVARASHWRVGWSYVCADCGKWHANLAGGYALTDDGAVATCYHVVQPGRTVRDGCLIAADEDGKVLAVTEVLAANRSHDTCILRVAGSGFKPLPLNTNVHPGDIAYCYSDPPRHHGYFSSGIVNRLPQSPGSSYGADATASALARMVLSTDWALGSSGSAVLDEFGNAIGQASAVATVTTVPERHVSVKSRTPAARSTMIVFHEAVAAQDVLLLVRPTD
jgi:hypothetical protein